jgi:immunity protein 17 of polymorphic toxin system
MSLWGIGMIVLGGGAIMAALQNWDWWFNINSAGGKLVHDAFGRHFARLLNAVFGVALLIVGIADVSGQWPVSAFLNAWLFNDASYVEEYLSPAANENAQAAPLQENTSGLSTYTP